MQRRTMSLLALGISSFFFFGVCMASMFGKAELSPEWVERLRNVVILNEFAKSHKIHLSDVSLTGYDLTGVKLDGATFENSEWKGIQLNRANLANTQFKKTKIDGVKFQEAVLYNVTFEDVDLREVSFFKATLKRVKFIRCKFNAVTADNLKIGDIEIVNSKIMNSSFSEGVIAVTVKGSHLADVEFTDLEPPSSLTFANSELKDVDFSRSVLETLVLNHVNAAKGGFTGGQVKSIEIRDSQFGLDFVEMQIDTFRIERSKIQSALNSSRIADLAMTDCKNMKDMTLYKVNVGRMEVQQCDLNDFALVKANVDQLRVQKARLTKNEYTASRIKSLMLENVSLGGQMDFTDAHVDHLVTTNVTKTPGLSLITTGSNVKFD